MRIKTFEEYQVAYQQSVDDPEGYWAEVGQQFQWRKPWKKVLSGDFSQASVKWYEGGVLNITENALDRHLADKGDQPAIIWEPNDPDDQAVTITYHVLYDRVCRFANVLKKHGVKKGDRVCIYLPMVPELTIAVLACARIGAVHSVVFGGFSAKSIADRINDAECTMVITSDGSYRGPKVIPMKETVDNALDLCKTVKNVIVMTRTRTPVSMLKGRDLWWEEEEKRWILCVRLNRWMRKIHFSFCILRGQQESLRVLYIPSADIWFLQPIHSPTFSSMSQEKCISVLLISAGSPVIVILFTDRFVTALLP
jgi:acetyl-CoA synthetase